jgi:hypothetical protein
MILLRKHTAHVALLLAVALSVVVLLICGCSSSGGDRPRLLYFRSAT